MTNARLPLELLPDKLAVCRLPADAALPAWALDPVPFITISRSADELSITIAEAAVPPGVRCEPGYRAFRVRGPLPHDLIGIFTAIANPLAEAGLAIFAISTFDTDYVMVKAVDLETALGVLERAGHQIHR